MKVTIEEACAARGYDLKQIEDAAALMPPALQKFTRATVLRAVLVEAINDGQVPDHSNYSQRKYEPIFDLDVNEGPAGFGLVFDAADVWCTRTLVGARLQILDRDNAIYFATNPNFMQLHSDALTIPKQTENENQKN